MPLVVIDTSVFIAAILSKNPNSAPSQILSLWQRGELTLIISPQLLNELVITLLRQGITPEVIEDLVTLIGTIAFQIEGAYEATFLDKIDPKDNKLTENLSHIIFPENCRLFTTTLGRTIIIIS
jgi:putative PIN family toxin of toxin-antitoxin system